MRVSKIISKTWLVVTLVALLLVPVHVHAQESGTSQRTPSEDVTAQGRAEERQSRIEQYKSNRNENLTVIDERRVASTCAAAQVITERVQSRVGDSLEKRRTAYSSIVEKLDSLSARINAAGVETEALDTEIRTFEADFQAMIASGLEYQTTVSDITAISCETDPQGFNAALLTARDQRVELQKTAQELKKQLRDTIKKILQDLKTELNTASAGEGA